MSGKLIAAGAALIAAVPILFAAAVDNAPRAAIATPECIAGAFKAKTETAVHNINVNSGNFANVPGTGIAFTQGAPGCVLLMFSSAVDTVSNQIKLRAVIDGGAYVAQPDDVDFTAYQDNYTAARAFNFVFRGIPAGQHTAVVQARPSFGSGSGRLGERSTIVFYRK
ncbi:MAG TPA: hypothetical protein VFK79_13950 [Xanthobacteraceae bacterium]|nr:hypothetical protein [Xanthobacteraceae bacterium]